MGTSFFSFKTSPSIELLSANGPALKLPVAFGVTETSSRDVLMPTPLGVFFL